MATTHDIEAQRVVHRAAVQLAALNFVDQDSARQLSQVAEALANLFVVVFYQAETGRATASDFNEAMIAIREALRPH
ncbi:type I toxin-antitoxin system ptaRNA1 family toxin [Burkholderia sp. Bp9017]|uniref:type I toxin-antitoxin system ptaRNA1 family toxin n=1 Tax=Burkholderia TaxID=32008 RepID=UPI000F5DD0DC|nr:MULTISPECIES: type I toxin-antitoxin system ptaRNA1 family toxin [Burkholderia]RQZ24657.1 type I toxin-antitoxin system ptaRNA1 family toxin [Burkholderia sp. Bp9017]RQZ32576.1 type I toxin-antitoxin system ptaRNA1 family toxin [Burkholderia sp. Bp9016]